jgi:hypothetical protein
LLSVQSFKMDILRKGDNHELTMSDFDNDLEDCFEPIKLTEEWLIKFGFESYSTHVNYNELQIKNKKPNKHIVVRLGIQNKYFSVFNHSECDFTELQFIRQLDFVHQLQNLYFALTGEELNAIT